MSNRQDFENLNFQGPRWPLGSQATIAISTLILFLLIWWLGEPEDLFWFLAIGVIVLAWTASYGWRDAILDLINFLNRLSK